MILRQTLDPKVSGFWDGGGKDTFDWEIEEGVQHDSKGSYVRISSVDANMWFCVACGKTDKQTLANAKRHLRAITKTPCKFEYIEEVK